MFVYVEFIKIGSQGIFTYILNFTQHEKTASDNQGIIRFHRFVFKYRYPQ